jgi:TolA-binding protein
MKHTLATLTLGTALIAAFAASPSAADKETRQMMADIRMLQEQSQELQNALGTLTSSLTEALKAVGARLDQTAESTRKSLADQKTTIDTLSNDVRALRERMDDNSVRLGQVTQEVDALRQTVLRMGTPAPPATDGAGDNHASTPAGNAIGSGLSPTAAWDQAQGDYFAGQWDVAIVSLEQFIKDFPKSEDADNAQVMIGNSYLNQTPSKNKEALDAYDLAIRTYPKGDKLAEAYYKKAIALSNLKRVEEARAAAEYVIKTYPDGSEATLAKQLLDKLPAPAPAKR